MTRHSLLIAVAVLFVCSCKKEPTPAPAPAKPTAAAERTSAAKPEAPAPVAPDKAGTVVSDAKRAAEEAKAAAEEAAARVEGAAEAAQEKAQGAAADAAAMLDSSFSLEKLKESVGSLSAENLKGLADKLLAAIQDKDGLVSGLKAQIGSPANLLRVDELKKSLDSNVGILQALKSKLTVVVDKLKASGLDVSKYMGALGIGS